MKVLSQGLVRHSAATIILAAFAIGLFVTTPTGGDFWWFDSSRHAMNSAFLHDLIFEGGITHPIEFSRAYYRQYPAINVGFYPPFLYMSTVPFLAIFGVTHSVTQSVIALYAFLAGMIVYLLCVRQTDRVTAVATALCLMASPAVALWCRQVQLDVPAVALILTTAYCLLRYTDNPRPGWLFATTIFLGVSVLTRVQAVFLVPAVLYFLFIRPALESPPFRLRCAAMLVAGVIASPAVLMAAYFAKMNQTLAIHLPGMPTLLSVENWIWYGRQLPVQLGYPFFVLASIGCLALVLKKGKTVDIARGSSVLVVFCLSAWLFFTIISNKDPRFDLPVLPFLAVLGAWGFAAKSAKVGRVLSVGLAGWLMYQSLVISQIPVVSGFQAAVQTAEEITPKNGVILISAHRDGSFIYDLRTHNRRGDISVRRADKLLVQIDIAQELGVKDAKLDEQGVIALLRKENIAVVVSETDYLTDQVSMRSLQQVLDSGAIFEEVDRVPLVDATRSKTNSLRIYRRKLPPG